MKRAEIMMVAGPVPFSDRVAEAMHPLKNRFHRSRFVIDMVTECREMIRTLLGFSEEFEVFLINGTGRNGIESLIRSLPSSPHVLNNGVWGRLMQRYNGQMQTVLPDGESFTELPHYHSSFFSFVAHDTEMATTNNVTALCEEAQKRGAQLLIDAMSSVVVQDINWNHSAISAVCFSSAKALRGPNGFAIVVCRKDLELQPSLNHTYLDLYEHRKSYRETNYAAGQLVTLFVFGLHEALLELKEEGVKNRRKDILAKLAALNLGMTAAGFEREFPNRDSNYVLPIKLPKPWTWEEFNQELWHRNMSTTIGHEGRSGGVMNLSTAGDISYEDIEDFCNACADIKGQKCYG